MSTYPSPPPFHHRFLNVRIDDISAGGPSVWVVPGFRGRIRKLHSVIDGAITGADAGITVEIGGTAVSGATLTITQSGSAAGDVDSVTVPFGSTNSFEPDEAIEIITDQGSTGTVPAVFTLELEPT